MESVTDKVKELLMPEKLNQNYPHKKKKRKKK